MEADRIASLLMLALLAYVASVWARQRDELEQRRQDGDGPASGRRSTVELPADCGRNSFVWRPTGRLGGGRRNHRISAGFNARPGDFPSFVALRVGLFYCGGTLITNQHVLTAAHCAEISPDIIASVSIYHWENGASMNSTKLEQEKVCIAPNYNFERLHSDIAVIKLQRPVQFSHLVQPACLPDRPLTAKEQAYTIGLGYTSQNPPVFAKRLQILPVRRANCSRLKSLEPFYDGHESTLCFRSNRRNFLGSACSGDSGGPVLAAAAAPAAGREEESRQTVYGVISYGPNSCTSSSEAAYSVQADVYNLRQQVLALLEDCA